MKKIAFLTMDDLAGYFAYDQLAVEPLARRNCEVQQISWRQAGVNWDNFELVIIRSTWDYQQAPDEFLKVLASIEGSRARLCNSLATVQWNINKRYLQDLQQAGVCIVPTAWESGLTLPAIDRHLAASPSGQIVCKPLIGAGADRTFWLSAASSDMQKQMAVTTFEDTALMVQPFIRSVVEVGEFSLFYFDSQYSHSILKTPRTGDFRVQEEHGGRLLTVEPAEDLRAAAERTLTQLPEPTLYARVDLVRLDDGTPAVMELELIEPSLYFAHDAESPERFACAVERWL